MWKFDSIYFHVITSLRAFLGALEDFDKVAKKDASKGDAAKSSENAAATSGGAVLADLPPGWSEEFLK